MKYFNPLVSIVIPVYNGANYVAEAIESALKQTYKNIEIIVVNDGSKDNTEEIVKSYGNKVRYFYKENGGTSTALNLGIKNMKGEYFSWLSHDDMYYPKKIFYQIEELKKLENKDTIIMSDHDGINENYEKTHKTNYMSHINDYPPRINSNLHPVIYMQTHGCTLLISKKCFDKVGLFDEEVLVAQDFEFFYRIFKEFPHKLISKVLVTARDSHNRQGIRSKIKCSLEYSNLLISIIESLSEDDIKLLAPSKLDFYIEMRDFFEDAGYKEAFEYINNKLIRNLQIGNNDLIGNKFGGHDLHLYLRERFIDSIHLVANKESDDINTFKYFDSNNPKKTIEFIKSKFFINTDIIHLHIIHNIPYNLIDLMYLPLMSKLKPIVWSIHDAWVVGGHCVHHFDCEKWKSHCFDCEYLDKPFEIKIDDTALNFEIKKQAIQDSDITAIVSSKWMENKIKASPIWHGKKIYRIPFGINQNIFKPIDIIESKKELNIDIDSFVIMFRSEDDNFKGLDIVKKSLEKIKSKRKITLITVFRKGLLEKFNDKYKIIEYDFVKDDYLLAKLYQACDIFLMPSKMETFGMMAIEAMSCGKTVLALEGTALPDVINSPECGIACKEEEYTEKLQYLIDNPNELIERGRKSLEFAKENYNKDVYVERIIKVYKEVMSNHKIDDSHKLILNQLDKYMNNNETVKNFQNKNFILFGVYYNEKYFTLYLFGIKITFKKKVGKIKTVKKQIIFFGTTEDDKYSSVYLFGIKITFKKKNKANGE